MLGWSFASPNKAVWLGRRRCAAGHGVRPYVGVGHPSLEYQHRRPDDDVVYRTVRDHFETFRAHARAIRVRGLRWAELMRRTFAFRRARV
jgi:hypothetical protein